MVQGMVTYEQLFREKIGEKEENVVENLFLVAEELRGISAEELSDIYRTAAIEMITNACIGKGLVKLDSVKAEYDNMSYKCGRYILKGSISCGEFISTVNTSGAAAILQKAEQCFTKEVECLFHDVTEMKKSVMASYLKSYRIVLDNIEQTLKKCYSKREQELLEDLPFCEMIARSGSALVWERQGFDNLTKLIDAVKCELEVLKKFTIEEIQAVALAYDLNRVDRNLFDAVMGQYLASMIYGDMRLIISQSDATLLLSEMKNGTITKEEIIDKIKFLEISGNAEEYSLKYVDEFFKRMWLFQKSDVFDELFKIIEKI